MKQFRPHLIIKQGETFRRRFQLKSRITGPVNVAGWVNTGCGKRNANDKEPVFTFTVNEIDLATGVLELFLDKTVTMALPLVKGVFDTKHINAAEDVQYYIEGSFEIVKPCSVNL